MAVKFFNPRMRLADIIMVNHNIILLLPRFGIPLGFGDKSLEEVCSRYNVPADFMVQICNVYTFEDYQIGEEDLKQMDMSMLVPYLLASHRYYTEERLPHIEAHLMRISDSVDPKYGTVLKQFFADYRREIAEHFRCEEEFDFPNLQNLQQGIKPKVSMSNHYEESHANLVDKLNDLPKIIYKYLPGNVLPEETMELVFDILQLSSDIQKHALVEDKVLLPYISILERELA